MHTSTKTSTDPRRGRDAISAIALAVIGLMSLCMLGNPAASAAASAPCRAILNESQLEHVNGLVEAGEIQERPIFGPRSIRLETVSRHGNATKLRAVHAKLGNAHLAFDYDCPALLEVSIAKRLEICAPNSVKEKIVCEKRWTFTGSSHRWVRLDDPIKLNIKASNDRKISVGLTMHAWFIPGHYVLEPDTHSSELRFGGS